MENHKNCSCVKKETPGIARSIGILNRSFKRYSEKRLEPYGLTNGLYLYLLYIHHNPGCSLVELRDAIGADKSYVTRAVAKCCDLGYVRKEQRKEDARSYCLFLTGEGQNRMEVIRDIPCAWDRIAESCLEQEECSQLKQLLNKLCEALR